ncbi:TPA_asm: P6 [Betula betacytorhabdovirus 1]|nr:TPA_asm: P6 [Betula betacytorhabdovirus 1]
MEKYLLGILNDETISQGISKVNYTWSNNLVFNLIYFSIIICVLIGIIRSVFSLSHKIILLIGELSWLFLEICILVIMLSPLHAGCNLISFTIKRLIIPCIHYIERKTVRSDNPIYYFRRLFKTRDQVNDLNIEGVHEI